MANKGILKLQKYNKLRSAISAERKSRGIELPVGDYGKILKEAWHENKELPENKLLNIVPSLFDDYTVEQYPFVIMDSYQYFELDHVWHDFRKNNEINLSALNFLKVQSNLFPEGYNFTVAEYLNDASHYPYIKKFVDFCDKYRSEDGLWSGSGDVPYFRFTPLRFDKVTQKYYTSIIIDIDAYPWDETSVQIFEDETGLDFDACTKEIDYPPPEQTVDIPDPYSISAPVEKKPKKKEVDVDAERLKVESEERIAREKIQSEERIKKGQMKIDSLKELLKDKVITFDEYLRGLKEIG